MDQNSELRPKTARIGFALLAAILACSVLWSPAQEETPDSDVAEATQEPEPEATPALSLDLGDTLAEAAASFDISNLEPIDLLRLIIAIAVILIFLLFGRRIVTHLLNRVAGRTTTTFDDELIDRIQGQIRWLVAILGINIGALIIFFDNFAVRDLINDILFWFYYWFLLSASYTSIHFFFEWYEAQLDEDESRISVFLPILQRFAMALFAVLAAVILLDHLGINVTGLAAAAALVGFAVALAAQDMIGDLISGYVILIDRPFRVGDRIDIPGQDIWGDVVEIGTRTTRIRTRDNNLVIMPNSDLADGQIYNYTYPDPMYRLETDLGIGYGEDLKRVRQVLTEAVRTVDGVLEDQPVQVLFLEFADSWMGLRVRWWIDTYADKRAMQDGVNSALQDAIEEHEIDAPYPIQAVELKMQTDQSTVKED